MQNTKVVNIYPTQPIITVNPPIRSAVRKVTKSISDIRKCIIARAVVEEVCGDKTVRLDFTNYDKNNFPAGHVEAYTIEHDDIKENPVERHEEATSGFITPETEYSAEQKFAYDEAYAEYMSKKNTSGMSRKEVRRTERAARDYANSVAKKVTESAPEIAAVENTNTVEQEEVKEPTVETVDVETMYTNQTQSEE